MSQALSGDLLARLGDFVAARTGLHFPPERWRDLERGVRSAAREFGFEEAEACGRWLLASSLGRRQIEVLASHLTVGETYFFRDAPAFEALETRVLPDLIAARRAGEKRLRLWSAGCCTGEEAYSLAILLSRLLPDWRDWNVTVLATDINPRFLGKATEGVFGVWSFRNTSESLRAGYFREAERGRLELLPTIKRLVTFAYLNLAEDTYPSLHTNTNAMDVILCRNVLMYFAPDQARRAVENLSRSLVEGGWLVVGASEASSLGPRFTPFHFPDAIFYRKDGRPAERPIGGLPSPPFEQAPIRPADVSGVPDGPSFLPETLSGRLAPEFPPAADSAGDAPANESEATPLDRLREVSALYERGRYAEAAESLTAWLSAHPDDAEAMALLARVLANCGQLSEALAWCRRALALDKLNPAHHYLCALVLEESGEVEAAARALDRALYLDPDFVLAHVALGNLAGRLGRVGDSARHRRNALRSLARFGPEDPVPDSEGMTAGRLAESVRSALDGEP